MADRRIGKIAVPSTMKLGKFSQPDFSLGDGTFPNGLLVSFSETGVSVSWREIGVSVSSLEADARVCERLLNALAELEIPELK